jgi:hypothetical protein
MRRQAHNRLWTLILMLLLCGASLAPTARVARADTAPTDPQPGSPPGDPQAGDPDAPTNGRSLPAPGGHRGTMGQSTRVTVPQQGSFGLWLLRLRMAFATVYRTLFRF